MFTVAASASVDVSWLVAVVQPVIFRLVGIRQFLPDAVRYLQAVRARELRGHGHVDTLVLSAFDVEKRIPAEHQDQQTHQGNRDPYSRIAGDDDAPNENHRCGTADQQRYEQGGGGFEMSGHELKNHHAARQNDEADDDIDNAEAGYAQFAHAEFAHVNLLWQPWIADISGPEKEPARQPSGRSRTPLLPIR